MEQHLSLLLQQEDMLHRKIQWVPRCITPKVGRLDCGG